MIFDDELADAIENALTRFEENPVFDLETDIISSVMVMSYLLQELDLKSANEGLNDALDRMRAEGIEEDE